MAPSTLLDRRARNGVERVRHQLLTALHLGKLQPGDRVPSVRRLSETTGLNRKTVHRAYHVLAGEGLLCPRPGSGTYVAAPGDLATPIGELVRVANRTRVAAGGLGLDPDVFASFLQLYHGTGLRGLPLLAVECNQEQLGMIEMELRSRAGLDARPVLLRDLAAPHLRWAREGGGVVTTHCHSQEVSAICDPLGIPVHRVSLDPGFPQQLLNHARRMAVIMVVRDIHFAPAFSRLLKQLSVAPELLERFRIVESNEAATVFRDTAPPAAVYVSPLVATDLALPRRFRRLRLRWRIEPGSLGTLKASLALDVARRRNTLDVDGPRARPPLAPGLQLVRW